MFTLAKHPSQKTIYKFLSSYTWFAFLKSSLLFLWEKVNKTSYSILKCPLKKNICIRSRGSERELHEF